MSARRCARLAGFAAMLVVAACGGAAPSAVDAGGPARGVDAAGSDAAGERDADPGDARDDGAAAADAELDAAGDDGGACARPCGSHGECGQYGDPCLACDPSGCCQWLYVSCATPERGRNAVLNRATP